MVDVGELTFEEKAQILYNHVNFGEQSQTWRSSVKPTWRRSPRLTISCPALPSALATPTSLRDWRRARAHSFVSWRRPTEHLIDTVNAMDDPLQAALILIYVHQAGLTRTIMIPWPPRRSLR